MKLYCSVTILLGGAERTDQLASPEMKGKKGKEMSETGFI
jgi:hypothetical protein